MTLADVGRPLLVGLGAYAGLCLLLFLAQRKLMYFPTRTSESDALVRAAAQGLRPWRDEQGRLLGWLDGLTTATTRLLLFHGNAGSALDRDDYVAVLAGTDREVLLFEYPGYGSQPGEPSQAALVTEAARGLTQLQSEHAGPVWLVGESLGCAVAAELASRAPNAVAGVLLVTPFARVIDVATRHYAFVPIGWLLRDRWDNVAALRDYRGPVGILIAGRDEVVGADQGRKLAQALGERPMVWEQPDAGHNSLDLRPAAAPWPEIVSWLESHESPARRERVGAPAQPLSLAVP